MNIISLLKIFFLSLIFVLCICIAFIFGINAWVSHKSAPYIFTELNQIPYYSVGVVLGTSKYYSTGKPNIFYANRINGAAELYNNHKVSLLLLSGDNRAINYNEPLQMKKDLLAKHIPETQLYLDYAGFRTLDSVIRTYKIFNTNNFIIISQRFHCERAIFIALHKNIAAHCFAVPDPDDTIKVTLREYLARVKAVIDLFILHKEPYFLGPIIPLPIEHE